MTPLLLAHAYLNIFFHTHDMDELYELFAEDMVFEGPFFQSDTAEAYINRLKADPPVGCSYELHHAFESADAAMLVYTFRKGEIEAKMAQLFEVNEGRIKRIVLIFDTGDFG